MDKFFLIQIKQTNGTIEKGVVVKDTIDAARQSYHAYLGAYAYGNAQGCDYVQVCIIDGNGSIYDHDIWDATVVQTEVV